MRKLMQVYGRKCNLNQKYNNLECQCECKSPKEHCACKKSYFWNQARCSNEISKYPRSQKVSLVIQ